MSEGLPDDANRVLLDVNAIAIGLTRGHPGHDVLHPALETALRRECLVFDYHPFRAQYLMTRAFGVDRVAARNSVQSFLRQPLQVVGATRRTLLDAYDTSAAKNHDVYDSFLVVLAREHGADCFLTTDTDFESLLADEPVRYVNPVPESVLSEFGGVDE